MRRLVPGSSGEKKTILLSVVAASLIVIIDQFSKLRVRRLLVGSGPIRVIPNFFDIVYVQNRGAAWSMLSGHSLLLLVVGLATIAALVVFFRKITENCPERYFAVAMLLSGIVGNSIDRFWHRAVIDFISLHWRDVYYYPVFNIADMAICTGTAVIIISSLIRKQSPRPDKCTK